MSIQIQPNKVVGVTCHTYMSHVSRRTTDRRPWPWPFYQRAHKRTEFGMKMSARNNAVAKTYSPPRLASGRSGAVSREVCRPPLPSGRPLNIIPQSHAVQYRLGHKMHCFLKMEQPLQLCSISTYSNTLLNLVLPVDGDATNCF